MPLGLLCTLFAAAPRGDALRRGARRCAGRARGSEPGPHLPVGRRRDAPSRSRALEPRNNPIPIHGQGTGAGSVLLPPDPEQRRRRREDLLAYPGAHGDHTIAGEYTLRPGFHAALRLGLADELADRYGKNGDRVERIAKKAAMAKGSLKRSNIRPMQSPIRRDFVIGQGVGRRTFNVYTGGS
jgi:hypothetical protein